MALVIPFDGATPRLGERVYVAPNATLIGDVELGDDASVWFGAVLRGDIGRIRIGARTNVQDLTCLHMTGGVSHTLVGADVTIGHSALLHGCTIGDACLIGMGSILLDGAVIGEGSLVAAGALVTPGKTFPPRSFVLGSPARAIREVSDKELARSLEAAAHYVDHARKFAAIG